MVSSGADHLPGHLGGDEIVTYDAELAARAQSAGPGSLAGMSSGKRLPGTRENRSSARRVREITRKLLDLPACRGHLIKEAVLRGAERRGRVAGGHRVEQAAVVEKLTAEIAGLRARLNMSSRDLSKPPSSEGYAKPAPKSRRKRSGRARAEIASSAARRRRWCWSIGAAELPAEQPAWVSWELLESHGQLAERAPDDPRCNRGCDRCIETVRPDGAHRVRCQD
jgi:hypothetical protein